MVDLENKDSDNKEKDNEMKEKYIKAESYEKNKEEQEMLEKQENKEKKSKVEYIKSKEILDAKIDLEKLKMLVEQGVLSNKLFESIKEGKILEDKQIKEIFDKIDEVENIHNIEKMLPKNLRITKKEYITAKYNEAERKKVFTKLESALKYIYNFSYSYDLSGLDLFGGLYVIFNKNLKKVQENTIDIKKSLET